MKKKKKDLRGIVFLLVNIIPLAAIGMVTGIMVGSVSESVLAAGVCAALGWYIGFMGQIIVHELGHMVGGLLSGYKFCSFRIGSLMFIKDEKGLRTARFSLAGTGGQCLMSPPDMVDGKMPVTLYNLSGVLANIIVSALCGAAWFALRDTMAGAIFAAIGMIGVFFAITNGIPMSTGMLDNDGKNAVSMKKDPAAQRALWLQLKVNEMTTRGVRIKDMPGEWFAEPSHEEMKNPLTAAVGVLCCARLMDEMRFEEADMLMRRYINMKSGIAGIHRAALICDRMFIEMLGENRDIVIERMLTPQQQKIMRALRRQPSVLRTEYALALMHRNDAAAAEQLKREFDKVAGKYPNPEEIESERELIKLIDEKYAAPHTEDETDGE